MDVEERSRGNELPESSTLWRARLMTSTRRLQQIQAHLSSSMDEDIFFGRECVNRVSFLRDDVEFVELAAKHPTTRFVVLSDGFAYGAEDADGRPYLWYASYEDLKATVDDWVAKNREGVPLDGIKVTFLGLDETKTGLNYKKKYGGVAYFGVEVIHDESLKSQCDSQWTTVKDRAAVFKLDNFDVSIYSHAKMYLDWMNRNRFCAGCGSRNVVIHAGTKLQCSSDKVDGCPVKNASVSNVSFPRTDCVAITAVTTAKFDKMLLARGKRFPGPMYSTVAGFMEPSETVEAASLREVWEETGVKAYKCDIIKTQPWPYPANMMIGCVVYVDFNGTNEVIDLGHDPELLDAKWVDTEEVKRVLDGGKADWFMPPSTAIAHHLLRYVIDKFEAGETH